MPHYFYVIAESRWTSQIAPPLAAAWQQKSFHPCQALCRSLHDATQGFATRYRLAPDSLFLDRVAEGLAFSKDAWRALVSDVLLVSAAMIPEYRTAPETLRCLLEPTKSLTDERARSEYAPIEQAHFGRRDLVFGGAFYRPEHVGWNDAHDVQRLADYLERIDPANWTPEQLVAMTEIPPEDREEELAFAAQCFADLTKFYRSIADGKHIVVCEVL